VRVFFGDEAYAACRTLEACRQQLSKKADDDITPFLQVFNSWRRHDALRPLACAKRLGHIAAQLMGVPRVRLYQDSLFVKRPGDDETLWHMDLATAPLDTNAFVTVWIPLTPVPATSAGGSPLRFLTGSHADKAKDYWYDPHESDDEAMLARYPMVEDHAPLALGDATFHHGWVLHGSPPNRLPDSRVALSFAYAAADARTLGGDALFWPDHEDEISYEGWLDDVGEGGVIDHPLTPVIYP
jgi:ectoine hydroxylase-related dioxygenase (phytanoyl-CoA dioxygenase family)